MDDQARLRRKDTTKGPPLRILSLDGGGVRGYSMLIILEQLMHKTFVEIHGRAPKRHELPKPCEHFDLIAGTGTGGLIAIMLGRLRMDLETCRDVYVRMTRRVFETDKTIAGIPYKSTMFKASKLEEAIRECVREHTVFEDEGNDVLASATPMSSTVQTPTSPTSSIPQRTVSQSSRYSQAPISPIGSRIGPGYGALRWGNPNTELYDTRENRTKTAVTAVLQGTSQTRLLRSYDSRKEPAPHVKCTIWQAGRATSAVAMAFKPIKIGQTVYLDEGGGKYNPSPLVLDEACRNEWPGREVGVFISIGTGKRPANSSGNSHDWWQGLLGGSMDAWADARRRLISKLEACETTHQSMLREHLQSRGVSVENYYRLNVEVGVGEFGMNEWNRLSDISTSTQVYLSRQDVDGMNNSAAAKMAKIHFAKIRHERAEARRAAGSNASGQRDSWQNPWDRPLPTAPPPANFAVELPGDDHYYQTQPFRPQSLHHHPSVADQKYSIDPQPRDGSWDASNHPSYEHRPSVADLKYTVLVGDGGYGTQPPPPHDSPHTLYTNPSAPPPNQALISPTSASLSNNSNGASPRHSHDSGTRISPPPPQPYYQGSVPPPLPPKTPLNGLPYPDQSSNGGLYRSQSAGGQMQQGPQTFLSMGDLGRRLPYPDVQGPPPVVDLAGKPSLTR